MLPNLLKKSFLITVCYSTLEDIPYLQEEISHIPSMHVVVKHFPNLLSPKVIVADEEAKFYFFVSFPLIISDFTPDQ